MLIGWENFYGMVGQTAGTRAIGLMFVVITLGATLGSDVPRKAILSAVPMLVTPTLVHFGAVLLIAMLALVPKGSNFCSLCLLVCGVAGMVYVVILGAGIFSSRPSLMDPSDVGAHASYVPVPAIAYLITVSALAALAGWWNANLALAAGVAILMAVGIRNAWGMALFVTRGGQNEAGDGAAPKE